MAALRESIEKLESKVSYLRQAQILLPTSDSSCLVVGNKVTGRAGDDAGCRKSLQTHVGRRSRKLRRQNGSGKTNVHDRGECNYNKPDAPNMCVERQCQSKPLMKKIPVLGARQIWGTFKATTTRAVRHVISSLTHIPMGSITIKRKYKTAQSDPSDPSHVQRW